MTRACALSLPDLEAVMPVESATDGDVFLTFLEPVLRPQLTAGDVVAMDNLSTHKVKGVRELIAACGAELLYLPPYSPDFKSHRKSLVRSSSN